MVIRIISIFSRWPPSICASGASLLYTNHIGGLTSCSGFSPCSHRGNRVVPSC